MASRSRAAVTVASWARMGQKWRGAISGGWFIFWCALAQPVVYGRAKPQPSIWAGGGPERLISGDYARALRGRFEGVRAAGNPGRLADRAHGQLNRFVGAGVQGDDR